MLSVAVITSTAVAMIIMTILRCDLDYDYEDAAEKPGKLEPSIPVFVAQRTPPSRGHLRFEQATNSRGLNSL